MTCRPAPMGLFKRVDPCPKTRFGRNRLLAGHLDEPRARRIRLRLRSRMASSRLPSTTSTWEIRSGTLARSFLDMRRHEVDHALKLHRQFAIGGGRADRERFMEICEGNLDIVWTRRLISRMCNKPSAAFVQLHKCRVRHRAPTFWGRDHLENGPAKHFSPWTR